MGAVASGSRGGGAPRRYDIDAIRVLALLLLIGYHSAFAFQEWGPLVEFIYVGEELNVVWGAFQAVNVWRIPILFLVSGMAFALAVRGRSLERLVGQRFLRIGVPLGFGFLLIAPWFGVFFRWYYGATFDYEPQLAHLWFLVNLMVYALLFIAPLMVHRAGGDVSRAAVALGSVLFRAMIALALQLGLDPVDLKLATALLLLAAPLALEVAVVMPFDFTNYAGEFGHGMVLGLVCFTAGFLFVAAGEPFWGAIRRGRWVHLALAAGLFAGRATSVYVNFGDELEGWALSPDVPGLLIINLWHAVESAAWMLAIVGFGSVHLNRRSRVFAYLSVAVFPVYIFHLPLQNLAAVGLFRLPLPTWLDFVLLNVVVIAASLAMYEGARRIPKLRLAVGLRPGGRRVRAGEG